MRHKKSKKLFVVDKIVAAGCQIDTAIYLTFSNFEEISICTLAHAAWGIVWPMLEKNGSQSSRRLINVDDKKAAWKKIDEFSTYCKHSKTDSEKLYQFSSGITQPALAMVIDDFSRLAPTTSQYMDIYMQWFAAKYRLSDAPNYKEAISVFPALSEKSDKEQKEAGLAAISKV